MAQHARHTDEGGQEDLQLDTPQDRYPEGSDNPRLQTPEPPPALNPDAKRTQGGMFSVLGTESTGSGPGSGLGIGIKVMLFALGFVGNILGLLFALFMFRNRDGKTVSSALTWVLIGMIAFVGMQIAVIQANGGVDSVLQYYGMQQGLESGLGGTGSAF